MDRKGAEGSADDAARPLIGGRKTFFQVLPELRFHGVFLHCCNAQTLQPAILHVRTGTAYHTVPDSTAVEYYPWRTRTHGATHAPQTDSKPSGWTALKRVKRPDGFRTVRTALKRACGFTLVPSIYIIMYTYIKRFLNDLIVMIVEGQTEIFSNDV